MGSKYQGTKAEIRALNAFIALERGTHALERRLRGGISAEGLSESQFGLLEALLHLGPMPGKKLAKKLLVTGGNITCVSDNLEKRGLISRVRDSQDRRVVTLALTAKGKALIKKVFPKHVEEIVREMSVLTTAELEELRRLCKKIGLQQNEVD